MVSALSFTIFTTAAAALYLITIGGI